ncbi:hypothetical protein TrLO_g12882 [Triparma laevis f. longispina]|uniref:Uncharacterized protein n=1 Tax=Triparma laevis f. longispina TaxID=1714387 RepID=A0A9W7AGI2_9STRA|nr:hypothetical protein TrLO_g12882 [Triparma laevis f. longispina]
MQPHCFHPPSLVPTPQASLAFCSKCAGELLEPLLTRRKELEIELRALEKSTPPSDLFPPSPTPQEHVQKLHALRKEALEKKQRNQSLSLEILQKQASTTTPPHNLQHHTATLNNLHHTLLPLLLSTYHTTCRTIHNLIDLKLYQLLCSFALTSSPQSLPMILNIPWVHDLSRYYPPLPSNQPLRSHVLRTAPTILSLICSILIQLKAILLLSPGDGYIHTSNIDIVVLDGTKQIYGVCDGYGNVYKLALKVSGEVEEKIPKSFTTGVTILASYIIRICVDQGVEVNGLQSMDFIGNLCRLRDVLENRLNSAEINNKI